MKSKHTKGEWSFRKSYDKEYKQDTFCIDIFMNGSGVSEVATIWASYDDKQAEANAKLIAAAPELLDVVTRLILFSEASEEPAVSREILTKAYRAIKKATA